MSLKTKYNSHSTTVKCRECDERHQVRFKTAKGRNADPGDYKIVEESYPSCLSYNTVAREVAETIGGWL